MKRSKPFSILQKRLPELDQEAISKITEGFVLAQEYAKHQRDFDPNASGKNEFFFSSVVNYELGEIQKYIVYRKSGRKNMGREFLKHSFGGLILSALVLASILKIDVFEVIIIELQRLFEREWEK